MEWLSPSTAMGTLVLGTIAGLVSGVILGFFQGRSYERRIIRKAIINQKGNNNFAFQDSKVGGGMHLEKRHDHTEGK